ncbi:MAG: YcgN family cysteine cluster protein [Ahrensia sp.]|nr:YcgN family cysteine cluster protein [Ahrensia sp.]
MNAAPFWQTKPLDQMSADEWESLCDGCGRCCLNKLEDWDTGEIYYTNVACKLFDPQTCRCSDYDNRFETVPDCIKLTPRDVGMFHWLPPTCAYRLLDEGKPLPEWHPLVSGNSNTVVKAGVSAKGRVISEEGLTVEEWEDHVVDWPGEDPTA